MDNQQQKVIIKLGTNAIFDSKIREVRTDVLEVLASDIYQMQTKGDEIIVVTSGAVGCGSEYLKGEHYNPESLKQARATVGQPILMQAYQNTFAKYGLVVGQLLLTNQVLNNPVSLSILQRTYRILAENKIIPIVNENDPIATEELGSFGDNDMLSAELLGVLNFDMLINLTKKGALIKNGQIITETDQFDKDNYDRLTEPIEGFGGLASKLAAANYAVLHEGKGYRIAKAGDSIIDVLAGKKPSTIFKRKI